MDEDAVLFLLRWIKNLLLLAIASCVVVCSWIGRMVVLLADLYTASLWRCPCLATLSMLFTPPKAEIGSRTLSYLRVDVAIEVQLLSSAVCLYELGYVVPRVAQFYHHVAIQPPLCYSCKGVSCKECNSCTVCYAVHLCINVLNDFTKQQRSDSHSIHLTN